MARSKSLFRGAVDWRGTCAVLAVALLDVAFGEEVKLLPLYAVGPAWASVRAAPRAVVGTGVFAALLALLLALNDDVLGTRKAFFALVAIALVSVSAAFAASRRTAQERRLAATRTVAEAAQRAIAPPVPPSGGHVRIAASYESAAAGGGAVIGGDFCDVVPIRNGVRFLMGDVQGKGLGPVGLSTTLLSAFRQSACSERHLQAVGTRMECALQRTDDSDRFATMVLAELAHDGELVVLNYGHPSPVVIRADGPAESAEPDKPGLPVGLAPLAHGEPGSSRRTLHRGDRVLLYTDGLSEARDGHGDFYPLERRTRLLLGEPLESCLASLRSDVGRHAAGGDPDDSALLLFEYAGSSDGPETSAARRPPYPGRTAEQLGCDVCAVMDCPLRTMLRPTAERRH